MLLRLGIVSLSRSFSLFVSLCLSQVCFEVKSTKVYGQKIDLMPFKRKHCTQKEKDDKASIKLQLHLCSLELITCSRDAVRTPSEERTQKSQRQKAAVTALTVEDRRMEAISEGEKSTSVLSVMAHSKSMLA